MNAAEASSAMDPTASQIEQALAECAREPVHIPGIIQPIGVLIAFERQSGHISYVSANASELFGQPIEDLLGAHARALLGAEVWHGLQNVASLPSFENAREHVGSFELASRAVDLHAFGSGDYTVVELEPSPPGPLLAPAMMREVASLMQQIEGAADEPALWQLTVRMLRAVSGFDRVMAYRFDHDHNGEVIAESCKPRLEPLIGLRFPHWDIPPQAREIMQRLPLRLIADIDAEPVPILAAHDTLPPLDITFANMRGVSKVHLQYLRNMGTLATMTLSIRLQGRLWGMISFHHGRARTPSVHVRWVCMAILPYLEARLALLLNQAELQLTQSIERVRVNVQRLLDTELSLEENFGEIAPKLLEPFAADGVAIITDETHLSFGTVPDRQGLEMLMQAHGEEHDRIVISENLVEDYPQTRHAFGDAVGMLMAVMDDSHALMIFRQAQRRQVRWAGSPAKTIEFENGMARLTPRGSFAAYLQSVGNHADAWLPREIALCRSLGRAVLASAERRSIIRRNMRQQAMMIDELNHRVRNILALIRSVSRQARRHQASLNSYSDALEKRINALALAHDIGAGRALDAISVKQLIALEAEPFVLPGSTGVQVTGVDRWIKADQGPIFALVVHELMTNAAKYGALKRGGGHVEVELIDRDGGLHMSWHERGGPAVKVPKMRGFGSTLIEQAVPYELRGRSRLEFSAKGLQAEFWLPGDIFDAAPTCQNAEMPRHSSSFVNHGESLFSGAVLLLEDNYMIATDMVAVLSELGFESVEVAGNLADAYEMLADLQPRLAVLDINLGATGDNSIEFALQLHARGLPFLFVTGYGERSRLPAELAQVPILSKPVATGELRETISTLLPE